MKANEAPEKLYVDTNDNFSDSILYGYIENDKEDDIEYIRKDAFIEKACKWLKENAYFYVNDYTGSLNDDMLVSEFHKAMKE